MVCLSVVPCVESQHILLLANFCIRWRWNSVPTTTIKNLHEHFVLLLWLLNEMQIVHMIFLIHFGSSCFRCFLSFLYSACISRWPKAENFINTLHSFSLFISNATWLVDTKISSLAFSSKSFRLISHGKSFKLMHPLDRKIWHCPYST